MLHFKFETIFIAQKFWADHAYNKREQITLPNETSRSKQPSSQNTKDSMDPGLTKQKLRTLWCFGF